jgi:hypothetical protein
MAPAEGERPQDVDRFSVDQPDVKRTAQRINRPKNQFIKYHLFGAF